MKEEERTMISIAPSEEDREQMIGYVLHWQDQLRHADEETRKTYKKYVEALVSIDDPTGLNAKAYGCYGGNEIWENDWQASADCLEKLLKHPGEEQAANSLGYIYFYGRLSDGKPDYEKAFRYFARAAAAGFYEARYKLADMYKNGYYVAKDPFLAYALTEGVYEETKRRFMEGADAIPFADAALRMGIFALDNEEEEEAGEYLLEADYAIRRRMACGDFFGDTKVFARIQELRKKAGCEAGSEKSRISLNRPWPFGLFMQDTAYDRYWLKVKKVKDGLKLTLSRKGRHRRERPVETLLTLPELGYCEKITRVTLRAKKIRKLFQAAESPLLVDEWDVKYSKKGRVDSFYLEGKKVFSIAADVYEMKKEHPVKPDKVYTFASVIFHEGGDTYDYICDIPGVKAGDTVVVPSYAGPVRVQVVRVFKKNISGMELPYSRYKKVIEK